MTTFLIIAYLIIIFAVSIYAKYLNTRKGEDAKATFKVWGYANFELGPILGFLTFSATLFSTFTILGIPDYFRTHGVGTWYFLGITDVGLAFITLWFGLALKKKIDSKQFEGIGSFINNSFKGQLAAKVYLLAILIFLLPYVAIQIRGATLFLQSVLGIEQSVLLLGGILIIIMLIYSWIGGLRAVMYSDAVQGVLLLTGIWIVGYLCITKVGGLPSMFEAVHNKSPSLLSLPGPKGLMNNQFLLASFISIVLMPLSQPQLTQRIIFVKTDMKFRLMCLGVAIFSILVILPTVFIGMYGAIEHPELSALEFLTTTFVAEQPNWIGGLMTVGLLAAAMSTTDSQLMALSTEVSKGGKQGSISQVKLIQAAFGIIALLMAFLSTKEIVALARVGFVGTALASPMIAAAVLSNRQLRIDIPLACLIALIAFIASILNIIPNNIHGIRTDLFLMISVYAYSSLSFLAQNQLQRFRYVATQE